MNEFVVRTLTASVLIILGAFVWLFLPAFVLTLILIGALAYILVVEWPPLNPWHQQKSEDLLEQFKAVFFTLIYPILPFALLIVLNQFMGIAGRQFLLFLCCITFTHDTGAYIIGRLYGRHKIMPTVSPRKTWEGFFGGYVFALVVGVFFVYYTHIKMGLMGLPIYILLLNGAGLAGDMFESYLKRRVGVKDSGAILPGHGGLLDRFDSILFVITAFFIVICL